MLRTALGAEVLTALGRFYRVPAMEFDPEVVPPDDVLSRIHELLVATDEVKRLIQRITDFRVVKAVAIK